MVARTQIAVAALARDGQILLAPSPSIAAVVPRLLGSRRGEQPEQAVVRECLEELGVHVHDPQPVPMPFSDPALDMHAFLITHWEGDPVNAAPEEHDDLRWFQPGELADLKMADPGALASILSAIEAGTR